MKLPYDDDGMDVPLSLSKADAYAMLTHLLQDKQNARFVLTPNDFYIQVSPSHTALFTQLVRELYPETTPENMVLRHDAKQDANFAELRDPALIDALGKLVGSVSVEQQSKAEGRQRVSELVLDHKLTRYLTTMLVQQERGPRSV